MGGQSSAEKTEQPTPKKLQDARKKGQVPNSKEVVSASLISVLFLMMWILSDYFLSKFSHLLLVPSLLDYQDFDLSLNVAFSDIFMTMVLIIVPFILTVVAIAILSNFAQIGAVFSFEPIKPDMKKLNPVEGMKKIFKLKNFVELIKSIIKITLLSILIYMAIRQHIEDMIKSPSCGEMCLLYVFGAILKIIVIYTIIAFIIIAVADLFFQRWQFTKDMMMTKEEVKREYKEMEGNPEIKSQRKQFHRELLQEDQNQSVKSASALVTNPTHIAVALYYHKTGAPLPVVFAKGKMANAAKMRKYAEEAKVPIIENVALAHALYKLNLFEEIPYELIEPVSKIMRWVQLLKKYPDREIPPPKLESVF